MSVISFGYLSRVLYRLGYVVSHHPSVFCYTAVHCSTDWEFVSSYRGSLCTDSALMALVHAVYEHRFNFSFRG